MRVTGPDTQDMGKKAQVSYNLRLYSCRQIVYFDWAKLIFKNVTDLICQARQSFCRCWKNKYSFNICIHKSQKYLLDQIACCVPLLIPSPVRGASNVLTLSPVKVKEHSIKGCLIYDTKLHLMERLQFLRSGACGVPLHCYYSQVYSVLQW